LHQIEELYHSAREREPRERAEFLAQACGGDEELRQELDQLLAPRSSNGNILDNAAMVRPAVDLLASSTVAQLSAGTKLGTYEILALIGKGGMGEASHCIVVNGCTDDDVYAEIYQSPSVLA
jgi:hypothetical protein